jgi:PPOX class probable F420-dependent enzyme
MTIASNLPPERRDHVERRLHGNLMAWLTTVRPDGRPDSVPVWFLLRADGTILLFSQPGKVKLRNIAANPHVALGLDVTDIGRDIVRIEGTAVLATDALRADAVPEYVAKYTERIGALFGTARQFADTFTEAIVITPRVLRTSDGVAELD